MSNHLDGQLRKIALSGTANLLGAAASAVFNLLLIILVTRFFPKDTAGALFAATSVFMIALSICSLGTDVGLSRFLLRLQATGRAGDIRPVLGVARGPIISTTVLVVLFAALGAPWIARLIGLPEANGSQVIIVLLGFLPCAVFAEFCMASARALGMFRSTVLSDRVLRPALQPAAAMAVALAGGGLFLLAASWAVPYVFSAVLSYVFFRKVFRPYRTAPEPAVSSPRMLRAEFWGFTWPRSVSRISQALVQRSDIVIVAALVGPAEAAVYTASTRFVALGQFGVQAIQQVLQPRFSQMLALNQHKTLKKVFKTSTAWNMVVSWPIYVVAALGADFYLQVFGSDYVSDQARWVVWVMALAMLISTACGPLDSMLLMAGRSTTSLWISLVGLTLNITLCFILIPSLGIFGAAFAWALAIMVRNILTFVFVQATLKMNPWGRAGFFAGLSAVLGFGLPLLVVVLTGTNSFAFFAAGLLTGLACFAGAVWAFRRPLQLGSFAVLGKALARKAPATAPASAKQPPSH